MNRKGISAGKVVVILAAGTLLLFIAACQVGQTLSGWFATDTPTPTFTFTPTATATFTLTPTATLTFTPTATATATNTPRPTATKTPAASGAAVCNGTNSSIEAQTVSLINKMRADNGVAAVSSSSSLAAAARAHSKDMAENNYFSHTGSDGSTLQSRLAAVGYSFKAAGEILFAGSGGNNSPYSAVSGWNNSSSHHDIMLDGTYTEVGVGYWCDPDSEYEGYYTADFGRR